MADAADILEILDSCCDVGSFPMLDNGYVYPAATRLCLFRSADDWAMTIEVFGYSPRSDVPSTSVYAFGSRLRDRHPQLFRTQREFDNYLAHHPHDEQRYGRPMIDGDWIEEEFVALDASDVLVRGRSISLPSAAAYGRFGIVLTAPPRVAVFELARYLAEVARDDVLATVSERRVNVRPEMPQILQLEEWHHPNVIDRAVRPSGSQTFQQLARVLDRGDVSLYRPALAANTHWKNWPFGGTL